MEVTGIAIANACVPIKGLSQG